jgi:hypothetical protein
MRRVPRFLRSRSKSPGRQSPRPMSPCRSFSERLNRKDIYMNSQRFQSNCPSANGQVQVPAVNFLDQVVAKPDEFKKLCDAIPQQEHQEHLGTVMFSIIEICDNPREGHFARQQCLGRWHLDFGNGKATKLSGEAPLLVNNTANEVGIVADPDTMMNILETRMSPEGAKVLGAARVRGSHCSVASSQSLLKELAKFPVKKTVTINGTKVDVTDI